MRSKDKHTIGAILDENAPRDDRKDENRVGCRSDGDLSERRV